MQNQTIIQSGQQTLRAYDDNGVLTPASGLDEYQYIIIGETINGGNTETYPLFNKLPLKVEMIFAKIRFTSTSSVLSFRLASGNSDFQVPVQQGNSDVELITPQIPVVIPPDDSLIISVTALKLEELRVLCRRVALLDPIIPVNANNL